MNREQMKQLKIPFVQITDGVTDTGELHSLSELGVTSISLNATETTAVNDVWFKFKIQRKVA